jgi:hypothetical protein
MTTMRRRSKAGRGSRIVSTLTPKTWVRRISIEPELCAKRRMTIKYSWGFWKHRPDLKDDRGGYSYYEFVKCKPSKADFDEDSVLSTAEPGFVTNETGKFNVISSSSTGYGGETTVNVDDDFAELLEKLLNSKEV